MSSSAEFADDSEGVSSDAASKKKERKKRRRPRIHTPQKIDLDALLMDDDHSSAKPTHSEVEVIPTDEGEVFTEAWNEDDDQNLETETPHSPLPPERDIFEMLEELECKVDIYIEVAFEDLIDEFCYELLYVLDEAFAPIEVQDFLIELVDAIHSEIDFSLEGEDWNGAIQDVVDSFSSGFQKTFRQANTRIRNRCQYHSLRSLYDIIGDSGITMRNSFNQAMKTLATEIDHMGNLPLANIPDPLEKSLKKLRKKSLAAELKLVKQKWQLEAYEARMKRLSEMTEQIIRRRPADPDNEIDLDALPFVLERLQGFDISPVVKYRDRSQQIIQECRANELTRVSCNEVLDIITTEHTQSTMPVAMEPIPLPQTPKPEHERTKTFKNIQTKWREIQRGYQKTLDDATEFLAEVRINEEVEILATPRRNHRSHTRLPWT